MIKLNIMKTTLKFFTYGLLISSLVFTSCTLDGEVGPIGPEGAQGIAGIDGTDATNGADEVVIKDYNLNALQGASSTIYRDIDGITAHFKTTNLIPNNAYTLWFVVFGETPGPPTTTFAAGHIAGETGTEIFSAFKSVDTDFNNPLSGEVHIALRTHGPAQPGMIPDQIQTMDGGCSTGFPSGPVLYSDSDSVGYCANIQVGIHPPVN